MTTIDDALTRMRRDGIQWPHDMERLLSVIEALLAEHPSAGAYCSGCSRNASGPAFSVSVPLAECPIRSTITRILGGADPGPETAGR